MHPDQLATLEAIAETGTFEAAAARLGISPSAASQRIRALESALGRILVQRTTPCAMTDDGAVRTRLSFDLQRHTRMVEKAKKRE